MTYVGATPTTGDFKKLDSITTSSATTFNLRQNSVAVYPQSANHCIVSLNGVIQAPVDAFTIVNDTIVFASSLASSDVINFILVLGNVNDIGTVSDDTVSTAKIQADAINASKIADDSISEEHLDVTAITGHPEKTSLVDADKFIISDSAASNALKYVQKSNMPSGDWTLVQSGAAGSGDAALTIAGCFTSTYKIYKIFFYDWNGSDDAAPYLRWLTATNTEQSGSNTYFYSGVGYNTSGGGSNFSGNDNQFQILGETVRHDSDEHLAWEGTLYNPAGTTLKKRLVFAGGARRTGNYSFNGHGSGEWNATTAITGFKAFPSAGTFDSCSFEVYGLTS